MPFTELLAGLLAGGHRHLDRVVHGSAAGLRSQHLAAEADERRGYPVPTAITQLLVLNIGGVVGLVVGGFVADRRGIKGTTMVWSQSRWSCSGA